MYKSRGGGCTTPQYTTLGCTETAGVFGRVACILGCSGVKVERWRRLRGLHKGHFHGPFRGYVCQCHHMAFTPR